MPQRRDSATDPGRVQRLDPLLELVDLVVQCIDQIEEVLGDLVDDAVDDHAGAVVGFPLVRQLSGAEVAGVAALRGLAYRHDALPGRDDVDLLVEDAVLLADRDRQQEHTEDVAIVTFEPGPRLVVVSGRLEQLFERALVDLRGSTFFSSSSPGSRRSIHSAMTKPGVL